MEHFFYDKHQLGMWELQHDILYGKIPPNRYGQLIDFAWSTGRETARKYGEKYQTSVPSILAARLELSVLEIEDGLVLPEYQIYSEYFSNLKRIVLHRNAILAGVKRAVSTGHVFSENYEQIRELFIAHEVYHHIECHHQGLTSQKQRIVTFKIGPLQLTSGVRALCEIGAHSFTKALLKIEEDVLYDSV